MINFMFAVLGSTLFWTGFFVIGMVIGTLLFRNCAPKCYNWLVHDKWADYNSGTAFSEFDKDHMQDERVIFTFVVILTFYVFWPIALIFFAIKFIVKNLLFNSFIKIVKTIDKTIPDIKIVKKEKDE